MKQKKVLLVLSLVLGTSLSLGLSGCGSANAPDAPKDSASVSAPAEDAGSLSSTDDALSSDAADDTPAATGKIWLVLDENTAAFAESFDVNEVDRLQLNVSGETGETFETTDSELIDRIFWALDQITLTGETQETVSDADQTFTFYKKDGSACSITFNDNNLSSEGVNYLMTGDEDLWDAVIELRERVGNPTGVSTRFTFEEEETGDGTLLIFCDELFIDLPTGWFGNYIMETNGDHVIFYHKASREAWRAYDGSDGGVLFGISWYEDKEERENSQYIGKAADGGYYYIDFVSDLQAFAEDESIVEGYTALLESVEFIANSAYTTAGE